jgi:hypothetical protein
LCKRFTKFVLKYDLMTSDSLIVPMDEEENQMSQEIEPSRSDVKQEEQTIETQHETDESEA